MKEDTVIELCAHPNCEYPPGELVDCLCKAHRILVGGRYRHFKGGLYEVLAIAQGAETNMHFVVYRSLTDKRSWARPVDSFLIEIEPGIRRFTLVPPEA